VIACRDEEKSAFQDSLQQLAPRFPVDGVRFTKGGGTRQESVWNGLSYASQELKLAPDELVLVHDAARCLIDEESIAAVVREAAVSGAATLAVPVTDTVVRAETRAGQTAAPVLAEILKRDGLWAVQTPQVVRAQLLQAAHARARSYGISNATDDSGLVREIAPVSLVRGCADNIKVTHPSDVAYAWAVLSERT
jgi:2-C-methyl-D-erythritol 4-phosphate cytidylyltransferase